MIYILAGQDDFSIGQALEEIKKGIDDQMTSAANTTTLEGQQASVEQLKTVCEAAPFLAEKRLVIVKGLLGRFESRGKSSRKKTIRKTDKQDEYRLLGACIREIPDSTTLVLVDSDIGSTNPLLRELADKAEVRSFPLLRDAKLRQWIQQRVKAEGGSISSQAVDLLSRLVGSSLWVMSNEISKLAAFATGRRIEEDDVKKVVSYAQQANVFTMVDAILEFKAGEAEHLLQRLLQEGATPAYLLVMLSRQVRMIVLAKELAGQRKSKIEIQNKVGLPSEFALRKTLEQAGRYSWERLKAVYKKLLEADLAIKTGKYEGDLALNILFAELCQRRKDCGS